MKRKVLDVFMKEYGMDYHCHSCDKSYKTARELDRHIKRVHKNNKPRRGWKRRN